MNVTMKRMIRDIVQLRRKAGLTQQQVADLANEPCRTFIAHLEQGRRERLNLEKLYATLHVLFTITKKKRSHGSVLSPRKTRSRWKTLSL